VSLITLKETKGFVQRRLADGLYWQDSQDFGEGWGTIDLAQVWRYQMASDQTRVEMVPVTIKTYYIVNTSGDSYVPPV